MPFDQFVRRLVVVWVVSLIGIAGLALISGQLFYDAVSRTDAFADIINLAGRQRTLSQQVFLFAGLYVQAETETQRAPYRRQLRDVVELMASEFVQLESYVDRIPALKTLYYAGQTAVKQANQTYWDSASALLESPEQQLSPRNMSYNAILQQAPAILNDADLGVQAVKLQSVSTAAQFYDLNLYRILIILSILAAQFTFAFWPAIRRINQKAALLQREIIERLKAEADLRASEQRFRMLIETAPVGIFQADPHGTIIWVNSHWQSITGVKADAVSSLSWIESIRPRDRQDIMALVRRHRAEGTGFAFDFQLAQSVKAALMMHVTVTPLKDSANTVIGYIGMLIDITGREQAHEQAMKLESERQRIKILGQFIRDTSHDLRTPLSVIKSGLYLVSRMTDLERIHTKVTVIDQHVNYLTVVIEQLHEMAILDTLTELTLMPMVIAPLLRDVMNELALRADQSGKTAHFEVGDDLPATLTAPEKLLQAVRAVVNNALQYTEAGGRIEMKAVRAGRFVEISISDDGIGIAPETLPHVFNRFYKADQARGMGGGAGLGLPIAKRVIELHGGQILLESQPDTGTTVRMTLMIASNPLADSGRP